MRDGRKVWRTQRKLKEATVEVEEGWNEALEEGPTTGACRGTDWLCGFFYQAVSKETTEVTFTLTRGFAPTVQALPRQGATSSGSLCIQFDPTT